MASCMKDKIKWNKNEVNHLKDLQLQKLEKTLRENGKITHAAHSQQ